MVDARTAHYAGYAPSRPYRSPASQVSSSMFHLPSPTRVQTPHSAPSSFLPFDPFVSDYPSSINIVDSASSPTSFSGRDTPTFTASDQRYDGTASSASSVHPSSKSSGTTFAKVSKYTPSVSGSSVSSGSSRNQPGMGIKGRMSTGRGGSGNILKPAKLKISTIDEAEVLRQRRLRNQLNPRAKIANTGRGGTGNIKSASEKRYVPFDTSQDPDDLYEKNIFMKTKMEKELKPGATGRGGSGNAQGGRSRTKSFGSNGSSKKKQKIGRRSSIDSFCCASSISGNTTYLSAPSSSYASSFTSHNGASSIVTSLTSPSQSSFSPSVVTGSRHGSFMSHAYSAVDSPSPTVQLYSPPSMDTVCTTSVSSMSSQSQSASSVRSLETPDTPTKDKKRKWWKLPTKRSKQGKEVERSGAFLEISATPTAPSLTYPEYQRFHVSNNADRCIPAVPEVVSPEEQAFMNLRRRLADVSLQGRELEEFPTDADGEDGNDIINSYFSTDEEESAEDGEDPDIWTLREEDFADEIAYTVESFH